MYYFLSFFKNNTLKIFTKKSAKKNIIKKYYKKSKKFNYNKVFKFFFNFIITYFFIYLYYYYYVYLFNYLNIYYTFFLNLCSIYSYKILLLFTLFTLFIFKYNLKTIKSIENFFSFLFFFFFVIYLFFNNNFLFLIIIFEIQSLALLYNIISSSNSFLKNTNYFKTTKNHQIWLLNSISIQFWISFFSSFLLFYSLLIFFKDFFFIDWLNIEIFIHFLNIISFYLKNNELLIKFFPLILVILIKLGLFPFFFWKPELYKNLTLNSLFIYMTSYSFSIIFFFILLFSFYFYLINYIFYYYINKILIISLIFLPIIIYSIVEVRTFLAYSSIFHILLILVTIFINKSLDYKTYLYFFNYIFYIFFFFLLLYYLSNYNLWYLNEFQNFLKYSLINTVLGSIFLGMAGIPPFFGFFSKILIISNLYFTNNYYLFILFFVVGFILAFYYIQNYRFFGFNQKNLNYYNNLLIINLNYNYLNFLLIFLSLNNFIFFFFNDFFIYSNIFSLK